MNQVSVQDVLHILEKNGVTVEQVIQLPYIRDDVFNYLPVTEINRDFGCDYQIQEGEFLNLFQYNLEDCNDFRGQKAAVCWNRCKDTV